MSEDTHRTTSWSSTLQLIKTSGKGTAKALARDCMQRQMWNKGLANYVEWAIRENPTIPSIDRLAIVLDLREYQKGIQHEYQQLETIKRNLHAIRTIRDPYYRAETLLVVKDQLDRLVLAHYTQGKPWHEQLTDMYRYIRETTYKKMRADMQAPHDLRIQLH